MKEKRAFKILSIVFLLLGLAGGIFWWKRDYSSIEVQDVFQGKGVAGTEFTITNKAGKKITLQIRNVELDPEDPDKEIHLYTVFYKVEDEKEWRRLCKPTYNDQEGRAVLVSEVWDNYLETNNSFPFYCSSGNIVKCLRMGYKPSKVVNGQSLKNYHRACLRMMKADYCGDGTPHTRDGIQVQIYDPLGIQEKVNVPELTFEGAWNEDGAVCLKKTRLGHKLTEICKECPEKLEGRINEDGKCSSPEEALANYPNVLIFSESGENYP